MSTATKQSPAKPAEALNNLIQRTVEEAKAQGIVEGRQQAKGEVQMANLNVERAADRITLLESLLKQHGMSIPEGAEVSPDSEMIRAIEAGIALSTLPDHAPAADLLRQRYLRKNSWVLQPNAMWRDPQLGGAFPMPMAVERQAKIALKPFAHLLT